MFANMPPHIRCDVDRRAQILRERKQAEKELDLEHLRAQRQLLLERQAQAGESLSSPPISLRAAAFTEKDLDRFDAMLKSEEFKQNDVAKMQAEGRQTPRPMSAAQIKAMDVEIDDDTENLEQPAWAKDICSCRDWFKTQY